VYVVAVFLSDRNTAHNPSETDEPACHDPPQQPSGLRRESAFRSPFFVQTMLTIRLAEQNTPNEKNNKSSNRFRDDAETMLKP
jgi:hypothetical protein